MIVINLDVTKLQKERFKTFKRKDGSNGVACDLVFIETPNSECGQWMVKQSITKEEREAGVQLPILGNAKSMERGGTQGRPQPADRRPPAAPPKSEDSSDLPF